MSFEGGVITTVSFPKLLSLPDTVAFDGGTITVALLGGTTTLSFVGGVMIVPFSGGTITVSFPPPPVWFPSTGGAVSF